MLNGTAEDERLLMGETISTKRTPKDEAARAAIDAGVGIHFSGHLHVNDTALVRYGKDYLVNIGVPSLAAFPPAFKVVTLDNATLKVATVSLEHLPIDPAINRQYRIEINVTGKKTGHMLDATDYGQFLSEHVDQLVVHRYLRREWPKDMAKIMPLLNLADLYVLGQCGLPFPVEDTVALIHAERASKTSNEGNETAFEQLDSIPVLGLLGDWYRLRMGSEMALHHIPPDRLAAYRWLIEIYARSSALETGGAQEKFARIFRMMGRYLSDLPSRDFLVNLTSGSITRNEDQPAD
jgi:hypothetical protein